MGKAITTQRQLISRRVLRAGLEKALLGDAVTSDNKYHSAIYQSEEVTDRYTQRYVGKVVQVDVVARACPSGKNQVCTGQW